MKTYKINVEKVGDRELKKLIAKEYKVAPALVELSIWNREFGNDGKPGKVHYGYYIPRAGYMLPVVIQNDNCELEFIRKEDYDIYWGKFIVVNEK